MPVYRPTTRSSASSRRGYPSWRRSGDLATGPRSTRLRRWSCSACSSRRSLRKMITAVVLAAGAATRFGSPKQAVLLDPVILGRAVWDDVPDAGLRGVPAELVPCDDLESPGDVDFADELEGWP